MMFRSDRVTVSGVAVGPASLGHQRLDVDPAPDQDAGGSVGHHLAARATSRAAARPTPARRVPAHHGQAGAPIGQPRQEVVGGEGERVGHQDQGGGLEAEAVRPAVEVPVAVGQARGRATGPGRGDRPSRPTG